MFRRPSLEETTEWFWQLKSRSGGEKNFCFFQISNSLKRGVAERQPFRFAPVSVKARRIVPVRLPELLRGVELRSNLAGCCFFGIQSQTVTEFLIQPDQHVRLPVQTLRRSYFKMSSTAHVPLRGAFKDWTEETRRCLREPERPRAPDFRPISWLVLTENYKSFYNNKDRVELSMTIKVIEI